MAGDVDPVEGDELMFRAQVQGNVEGTSFIVCVWVGVEVCADEHAPPTVVIGPFDTMEDAKLECSSIAHGAMSTMQQATGETARVEVFDPGGDGA